MSRITAKLNELKAGPRKGFIPFITAGDPDLATSLEIALTLAKGGADVIELGVPFSDPMADGPTIQASSQRAVTNGVALADVLSLVAEIRKSSDVPILLFSYLNPLYRYGIERLAHDASAAGADGVLVTDAIDDEAEAISDIIDRKGLDLISLIAPTTTDTRLARIAKRASGFIYAVSRAGVTGARAESSSSAEDLVLRARQFTDLPIAVGFGISSRRQIEEVWSYADAAVVGSAIVAEIERTADPRNAPAAVSEVIKAMLPAFANEVRHQ